MKKAGLDTLLFLLWLVHPASLPLEGKVSAEQTDAVFRGAAKGDGKPVSYIPAPTTTDSVGAGIARPRTGR